ncbi:MAG TPA: hypothetical protein VEQ60_02320 [Longimicrobium sp.]|nr:hypothetical protein [Longimicrobium sp.]
MRTRTSAFDPLRALVLGEIIIPGAIVDPEVHQDSNGSSLGIGKPEQGIIFPAKARAIARITSDEHTCAIFDRKSHRLGVNQIRFRVDDA